MAGNRKPRKLKKEVVQIDADWLLGKVPTAPPRKHYLNHRWFLSVLLPLVCVGVVVWSWPYVSKEWLQWELTQQLADSSSKKTEEVLPILLALNALDPSRNSQLVKHRLLDESVPAPINSPAPIISSAPKRVSLSDTAQIRISDNDPPSLMNSIPDPTPGYSANLLASGSLSDTPLEAPRPPLPTESTPVLTSMRTESNRIESTTTPTLTSPPMLAATPPAAIVQTTVVAVEPIEPTPQPESRSIRPQEPPLLGGVDKLPLEKLLPLLTSTQQKIVQQAFNELQRRGMSKSQLDTAIALAQGDSQQRLQALEVIAHDSKFEDSIAWLSWMAESGDRTVRRRAISILGSMSNDTAKLKLRMLMNREPDSTIENEIRRVLLASGTALSVR
jgi:HEAT repeats